MPFYFQWLECTADDDDLAEVETEEEELALGVGRLNRPMLKERFTFVKTIIIYSTNNLNVKMAEVPENPEHERKLEKCK